MGNWEKESNCEACRIENDFTSDRSKSKSYMADVDNGVVNTFAKDGRGWGLAQWTYPSRKKNLLSFCKSLGKSIGDEATQVAFAVKELKEDFQALWQYLQVTQDLHEATRWVCYDFENPAVKDVEKRFEYAQVFDKEFSNGAVTIVPTQEELDEIEALNQPNTNQSNPAEVTPLKGKLSNETVFILQTLMTMYGYKPGKIDGLWGIQTKAEATKFFADLLKI